MFDAARALIGRQETALALSLGRSCPAFNGAVKGPRLLQPAADPVSADAARGRVARRCPVAPPTAESQPPGPNGGSGLMFSTSCSSTPASATPQLLDKLNSKSFFFSVFFSVFTSSSFQDSNKLTTTCGLNFTVVLGSLDFCLDALPVSHHCVCSFFLLEDF